MKTALDKIVFNLLYDIYYYIIETTISVIYNNTI